MQKMMPKMLTFILIILTIFPAYADASASYFPHPISSGAEGPPNAPEFTITQSISDGAQRTTLAFAGLAIMTGNLDAQSFFPPGKVADYTGFQYLRDNDPDDMGHNTSFLTRVANNVIYILSDSQFNQLKALAIAQQDNITEYGYKRFPLMKAYRRLLDGDIPAGSSGLDLDSVKAASRDLYFIDGQISFDRALLYANILSSFTENQTSYLEAMKGHGFNSWPDITNDQIRSRMQGLPQGTAVAVMTYAGDLFSWYAGSVDADIYFCPERHGTYYGSFYIKDAPAIGHEGYSIDEQLTATAGAALCDSSKGYVTVDQAAMISSLVDTQRNNLYASATSNIVGVRAQIATLLRSLLNSTADSDAIKAQVLALSSTYGDLDGENNYNYATIFAQVYQTLTTEQKTKLDELRHNVMTVTYSDNTTEDFSHCTTPYLYSSIITDESILEPYIADTDYLFTTGSLPTVNNASGAAGITPTSAILNGYLADTGGSDTTIIIYGGTTDGSTTPGNWKYPENLGVMTGAGPFSKGITGLTPGITYYYRCSATNSAGTSWATETASFVTKSTWAAFWEGPGKDWWRFSSGRP